MVLEDDLSERPESPEELRERAAAAPRSEDIDVTDVFDDGFVAANTDFETFDAMVAASPSPADSAADLELIPDGAWDEFVAEHTVFEDEEELVVEARDHWVAVQLDIEE
ncbi:hypothetical protein [Halobaculum sp. EA56]|uniref:hypothetical protein n=1 Tax=Halobaculum sp. EA56 TaxID=3421648 RepID=UPI003EBB673B